MANLDYNERSPLIPGWVWGTGMLAGAGYLAHKLRVVEASTMSEGKLRIGVDYQRYQDLKNSVKNFSLDKLIPKMSDKASQVTSRLLRDDLKIATHPRMHEVKDIYTRINERYTKPQFQRAFAKGLRNASRSALDRIIKSKWGVRETEALEEWKPGQVFDLSSRPLTRRILTATKAMDPYTGADYLVRGLEDSGIDKRQFTVGKYKGSAGKLSLKFHIGTDAHELKIPVLSEPSHAATYYYSGRQQRFMGLQQFLGDVFRGNIKPVGFDNVDFTDLQRALHSNDSNRVRGVVARLQRVIDHQLQFGKKPDAGIAMSRLRATIAGHSVQVIPEGLPVAAIRQQVYDKIASTHGLFASASMASETAAIEGRIPFTHATQYAPIGVTQEPGAVHALMTHARHKWGGAMPIITAPNKYQRLHFAGELYGELLQETAADAGKADASRFLFSAETLVAPLYGEGQLPFGSKVLQRYFHESSAIVSRRLRNTMRFDPYSKKETGRISEGSKISVFGGQSYLVQKTSLDRVAAEFLVEQEMSKGKSYPEAMQTLVSQGLIGRKSKEVTGKGMKAFAQQVSPNRATTPDILLPHEMSGENIKKITKTSVDHFQMRLNTVSKYIQDIDLRLRRIDQSLPAEIFQKRGLTLSHTAEVPLVAESTQFGAYLDPNAPFKTRAGRLDFIDELIREVAGFASSKGVKANRLLSMLSTAEGVNIFSAPVGFVQSPFPKRVVTYPATNPTKFAADLLTSHGFKFTTENMRSLMDVGYMSAVKNMIEQAQPTILARKVEAKAFNLIQRGNIEEYKRLGGVVKKWAEIKDQAKFLESLESDWTYKGLNVEQAKQLRSSIFGLGPGSDIGMAVEIPQEFRGVYEGRSLSHVYIPGASFRQLFGIQNKLDETVGIGLSEAFRRPLDVLRAVSAAERGKGYIDIERTAKGFFELFSDTVGKGKEFTNLFENVRVGGIVMAQAQPLTAQWAETEMGLLSSRFDLRTLREMQVLNPKYLGKSGDKAFQKVNEALRRLENTTYKTAEEAQKATLRFIEKEKLFPADTLRQVLGMTGTEELRTATGALLRYPTMMQHASIPPSYILPMSFAKGSEIAQPQMGSFLTTTVNADFDGDLITYLMNRKDMSSTEYHEALKAVHNSQLMRDLRQTKTTTKTLTEVFSASKKYAAKIENYFMDAAAPALKDMTKAESENLYSRVKETTGLITHRLRQFKAAFELGRGASSKAFVGDVGQTTLSILQGILQSSLGGASDPVLQQRGIAGDPANLTQDFFRMTDQLTGFADRGALTEQQAAQNWVDWMIQGAKRISTTENYLKVYDANLSNYFVTGAQGKAELNMDLLRAHLTEAATTVSKMGSRMSEVRSSLSTLARSTAGSAEAMDIEATLQFLESANAQDALLNMRLGQMGVAERGLARLGMGESGVAVAKQLLGKTKGLAMGLAAPLLIGAAAYSAMSNKYEPEPVALDTQTEDNLAAFKEYGPVAQEKGFSRRPVQLEPNISPISGQRPGRRVSMRMRGSQADYSILPQLAGGNTRYNINVRDNSTSMTPSTIQRNINRENTYATY